MKELGIDGWFHNWVSDYLKHKQQRVTVDQFHNINMFLQVYFKDHFFVRFYSLFMLMILLEMFIA